MPENPSGLDPEKARQAMDLNRQYCLGKHGRSPDAQIAAIDALTRLINQDPNNKTFVDEVIDIFRGPQ